MLHPWRQPRLLIQTMVELTSGAFTINRPCLMSREEKFTRVGKVSMSSIIDDDVQHGSCSSRPEYNDNKSGQDIEQKDDCEHDCIANSIDNSYSTLSTQHTRYLP